MTSPLGQASMLYSYNNDRKISRKKAQERISASSIERCGFGNGKEKKMVTPRRRGRTDLPTQRRHTKTSGTHKHTHTLADRNYSRRQAKLAAVCSEQQPRNKKVFLGVLEELFFFHNHLCRFIFLLFYFRFPSIRFP